MTAPLRWAWVEIDLDAVTHNMTVLRRAAGTADVWAVVKANAYGHGAVPIATAALQAGAVGLCVALTQEGIELRDADIDAPILVLSEQPPEQWAALVAAELTPTVYTAAGVEALAGAVVASGRQGPLGVHVKVDTGMHRVGVAPRDLTSLLTAIAGHPDALRVDGVFTHLAVADQPDHAYNALQLDRFAAVLADAKAPGGEIHAVNSAGLLAGLAPGQNMVRAGIALYGISPGSGVDVPAAELWPVMSIRARVSLVKRLRAGDSLSYGLRHTLTHDATIATVPIGYADGVPRRLHAVGGEVLIGGRRRPIVGVVTMDQLMVDCGDDEVQVGDDVVLIGRQGDVAITAADWADRLDTIGYEIVCGISARVPRVFRTDQNDSRPSP